MTYDRYEPANGPSYAGLGSPIREPKAKPTIGPDTEGLAPGFHKQSNGMLMYVPDMAVIDAKPYVKPVKRSGVNIQEDATRPVGFYDVGTNTGEELVRYWTDHGQWIVTGQPIGHSFSRAELQQHVRDQESRYMKPIYCVLRARPDLDALMGDPEPVYDEPEGDSPEDAGEPLDLQCDATRPAGFYTIKDADGDEFCRHWDGYSWAPGRRLEDMTAATVNRMVEDSHGYFTRLSFVVVCAHPDLDALVQA